MVTSEIARQHEKVRKSHATSISIHFYHSISFYPFLSILTIDTTIKGKLLPKVVLPNLPKTCLKRPQAPIQTTATSTPPEPDSAVPSAVSEDEGLRSSGKPPVLVTWSNAQQNDKSWFSWNIHYFRTDLNLEMGQDLFWTIGMRSQRVWGWTDHHDWYITFHYAP